MIRFRYQSQIVPPAPFVLVTLRNPHSNIRHENAPTQLDTAADRTVIPDALARELALPRTGTITVEGVGGFVSTMPLHRAELTLPGQSALVIEVAVSDGEPWILLGREFLNTVRVVLDGPQLLLEMG